MKMKLTEDIIEGVLQNLEEIGYTWKNSGAKPTEINPFKTNLIVGEFVTIFSEDGNTIQWK